MAPPGVELLKVKSSIGRVSEGGTDQKAYAPRGQIHKDGSELLIASTMYVAEALDSTLPISSTGFRMPVVVSQGSSGDFHVCVRSPPCMPK
jgi:hypothetical protein